MNIEYTLKSFFNKNKKALQEIYEKEQQKQGQGSLFIDWHKDKVDVYYMKMEQIPQIFHRNIKKDKRNYIFLSNDMVLYIHE